MLTSMGHVDARTASAWMDAPTRREVGWTLDGAGATRQGRLQLDAGPAAVPLRSAVGAELAPDTAYRFTIEGEAALSFRTDFDVDPPDARYAFAVGSCHQPFRPDGTIDVDRLSTLRALPAAAEQVGLRRTLLLGDQMYADQPEPLSLFAPSVARALSEDRWSHPDQAPVEDVRRWFERRYRAFWSVPAFRTLLGAAPAYMVWDDHELWDNFGSGRDDRSPQRQSIFHAAQAAYLKYQRLGRPRVSGTPDFSFRYGRVAALMLDIRTHRGWFDARFQVFADAQKAALPGQLEALADAAVLLVGVSVPFLTLPPAAIDVMGRALPEGNNVQDRWAFIDSRPDRSWLLGLLAAHADRHPHQKVIIVGGDIHIGLACELVRPQGQPPLRQLVSSAISNRESKLIRSAMATACRMFTTAPDPRFEASHLIEGADGHRNNPVTSQNVGFVEVEHRGSDTGVRLSLMSAGPDGRPHFPFRSSFF